MKIRFLTCLLFCGLALPVQARTQEPATACEFNPGELPAAVPEYLYCRIISSHLPQPWGDTVFFDFGQETGYWRFNMLTDSEGGELVFNSGIQALNYMTARGWEFVQAYTSGEKNEYVHMLLRIAAAELPAPALSEALAEPRSTSGKAKGKKRDGNRPAENDNTER